MDPLSKRASTLWPLIALYAWTDRRYLHPLPHLRWQLKLFSCVGELWLLVQVLWDASSHASYEGDYGNKSTTPVIILVGMWVKKPTKSIWLLEWWPLMAGKIFASVKRLFVTNVLAMWGWDWYLLETYLWVLSSMHKSKSNLVDQFEFDQPMFGYSFCPILGEDKMK